MRMILTSSFSVVFRGVQERLGSLRFTETMFTHTMILLLWKHLKLPTSTQKIRVNPQHVSQLIDYELSDPIVDHSCLHVLPFIVWDDQSCAGEGTTIANSQPIISEYMMKNAAAKWILKMREGHKIPQSVMQSIISGASSLFQLALSGLQQTIQTRLLDAHVSTDVSALVMDSLNSESQYTQVFHGLETSYKQNGYIRANFPFVVRSPCMHHK